jgi:hypothetical protein
MVEADSPPASLLPKQRNQLLLELAGRNALEVKERDQHFKALQAPGIGQQNRRRKAEYALSPHRAGTRGTYSDRANAGHNLALRQVSVTHQSSAAVSGQLCGVNAEQSRELRRRRPAEAALAPL